MSRIGDIEIDIDQLFGEAYCRHGDDVNQIFTYMCATASPTVAGFITPTLVEEMLRRRQELDLVD